MNPVSLGSYLKEARLRMGLERFAVAHALDVSVQNILEWEEEKLASLPVEILSSLISLYQLDTKLVMDLLLLRHLERLGHRVNKLKEAIS